MNRPKNTMQHGTAEYVSRLAKFGVGVRLNLGDRIRVTGSKSKVRVLKPLIAARETEIVEWLKVNTPPEPRRYQPKPHQPGRVSRESSRCCVCGEPSRRVIGDWGTCSHPVCVIHMPACLLPLQALRDMIPLFPALADAQVDVDERLAIIHDGDECRGLRVSTLKAALRVRGDENDGSGVESGESG